MIPIKSVRVGPFDVRIDRLTGIERDNNLGDYSATDLRIRLRESYASDQQAAETLLHEAIHALWHIYGVRAKEGEEKCVSLISVALASIIRDNPKFIEWLSGALK